MILLKDKIFLLFCIFCFNSLFSQEVHFKILDAESKDAVSNANIFQNNTLIHQSDERGHFSIASKNLPLKIMVKAVGFKALEVLLHGDDLNRNIYLIAELENISEVIIKSTLLPKALQKIPAAVSLVTASDFHRNDAVNILESFKNVPGVYINQGALNTNKINIRGIGGRSQYSTNRIQSFMDGIPLSTAEGELTLDDFDTETLHRIEIIKGPTSSIFGAGLGGSINLFSKNSSRNFTETKVSTQHGSFNTTKQVLQAASNSEKYAIFATFSDLSSAGFRENGKYKRQSAMVNGRLKAANEGQLSYIANFTRLKAYIPSSISESAFLNMPASADVAWAQSEGYESYDRALLGISYTQPFSKNFKNSTSIFGSFRSGYEPRPFDILDEDRASTGIRTQFNVESSIFNVPSAYSFGAQYYLEWYATGTFSNLYKDFPNEGSVQGKRLSQNSQKRNYANAFAQINVEISKNWTLEGGFNFNTTRYSLLDLLNTSSQEQSGKYTFKPIFSARMGSSYEIASGKNVYASISQGFSTPTVAETLTPEGQINTDLKAETGINYEAGFKGNWFQNSLYTEISFYSIQIKNLLVANRVAEDQYIGLNAGKTSHEGVELLVNYKVAVNQNIFIKPYLSAAVNNFKFKKFEEGDQDFSGNKLPGVPEYTLNVGADLQFYPDFVFFANFRSIGKIPLDDGNSGYAPAYQLINLKASYTLKVVSHVEFNFYMGVNNLFDKNYAASILTNAVGFGGKAPRYYYPGTPRNYFGGVQMRFLF